MQLNVPFGDLVASVESPLGENGVQVRLIDQGDDNPRVDVIGCLVRPIPLSNLSRILLARQKPSPLISGKLLAGENDDLRYLDIGKTHTFAA